MTHNEFFDTVLLDDIMGRKYVTLVLSLGRLSEGI